MTIALLAIGAFALTAIEAPPIAVAFAPPLGVDNVEAQSLTERILDEVRARGFAPHVEACERPDGCASAHVTAKDPALGVAFVRVGPVLRVQLTLRSPGGASRWSGSATPEADGPVLPTELAAALDEERAAVAPRSEPPAERDASLSGAGRPAASSSDASPPAGPPPALAWSLIAAGLGVAALAGLTAAVASSLAAYQASVLVDPRATGKDFSLLTGRIALGVAVATPIAGVLGLLGAGVGVAQLE